MRDVRAVLVTLGALLGAAPAAAQLRGPHGEACEAPPVRLERGTAVRLPGAIVAVPHAWRRRGDVYYDASRDATHALTRAPLLTLTQLRGEDDRRVVGTEGRSEVPHWYAAAASEAMRARSPVVAVVALVTPGDALVTLRWLPEGGAAAVDAALHEREHGCRLTTATAAARVAWAGEATRAGGAEGRLPLVSIVVHPGGTATGALVVQAEGLPAAELRPLLGMALGVRATGTPR